MKRNESPLRSWIQIWAPPLVLAIAAFALYETGVLADTPAGERPTNWHEVTPQNRCGSGQGAGPRAVKTIFRGVRPNGEGLQFLQSQGIDHVMNLEMDDVSSDEVDLVKQLGLSADELLHPMGNGLGVDDNDTMIAAVAELRRPENFPIYVHCHYGDDRTGMIIALHRVFDECWAPKDAEKEWSQIEGWVHHLFQEAKHIAFHKIMKNADLHQYYQDQLQKLAPAMPTAEEPAKPQPPDNGQSSAEPVPMHESGGVTGVNGP